MMPVHKLFQVFLIVAWLTCPAVRADDLFRPQPVVECLQKVRTANLEVLDRTNPFYLRGDFNGDGKPDYALQVRSSKTGSAGLLVCAGGGAVFLLGSGIGGNQFSDMPRDAFLAPQWEVFTKQDVAGLRAFQSNVPRPVPVVKSESIAMIWEDGISLIYWDGAKFRWAGSKE
jgi:hypothetical protein